MCHALAWLGPSSIGIPLALLTSTTSKGADVWHTRQSNNPIEHWEPECSVSTHVTAETRLATWLIFCIWFLVFLCASLPAVVGHSTFACCRICFAKRFCQYLHHCSWPEVIQVCVRFVPSCAIRLERFHYFSLCSFFDGVRCHSLAFWNVKWLVSFSSFARVSVPVRDLGWCHADYQRCYLTSENLAGNLSVS